MGLGKNGLKLLAQMVLIFNMIGRHPEKGDPIYPGESYTKEEFFKAKTYPKIDYTFWKLINGEKYYIKNNINIFVKR